MSTSAPAAPRAVSAAEFAELQEALPQYEILGLLGRGGMGAVYRARQRSLDRVVALKVLPGAAGEEPFQFVQRFRLEARTMARLLHPHIVPVYDFGETETGQLYYTMALIEGTDLARELELRGVLSPARAVEIALAICDALACAHAEGVVHRDIKPSNVLLARDGRVRVADFGLAKVDQPQPEPLTGSTVSMGSQGYLAPEAANRAAQASASADLYALGVVLYQMLTGDLPRGMFKLPSQKVPGLDPAFDHIVARALEEDPAERYQSAEEFARALQTVSVVTPSEPPRTRRFRARLVWSLGFGIAAAVAVLLFWPRENINAPRPRVAPPAPAVQLPPPKAQETRDFAVWLLTLPGMRDPANAAARLPDLFLFQSGRNLQSAASLPPGPLRIIRARAGALPFDELARRHLEVLGRLPELAEFRAYAVQDPAALLLLRNLPQLAALTFNSAPEAAPFSDTLLVQLPAPENLATLRLEGWRPFSGKGFAALQPKQKLHSLSLKGCAQLSDDGLAEIARFPNLRSLQITCGSAVTDAGLAHLAQLRELDTLQLEFTAECRATGSALAQLSSAKLRTLELEGAFPGGAFKFLAALSSLETLHCPRNSSVTDDALACLKKLPNLRSLKLEDTSISGAGFAAFPPGHPLTHLRLDDCKITDDGLRAMAQAFPQLTSLMLSHGHQDRYDVETLVEELARLPKLTTLNCSFGFNDANVAQIARLTNIRRLSLAGSRVTNDGVAALKTLTALEELDLSGLPVDDRCIPALQELPRLTTLDLRGTAITEAGVDKLRRELPRCTIRH